VNAAKRQPKIEVYQDNDGDWRWQVIAANGRIVGVSSEGYRKRADCLYGAHLTCQAILALNVVPSSRAIN
jgi:uncharacterized protein YegP (UPF0339 family)